MSYAAFLERKAAVTPRPGLAIDASDLHDSLYEWQANIVRWVCDVGRAAIWADTLTLSEAQRVRDALTGHRDDTAREIVRKCDAAMLCDPRFRTPTS